MPTTSDNDVIRDCLPSPGLYDGSFNPFQIFHACSFVSSIIFIRTRADIPGKSGICSEIRSQHILQHHSLGIEKRTVQGNGRAHDFDEAIPIMIEKWNNNILQLVIKR